MSDSCAYTLLPQTLKVRIHLSPEVFTSGETAPVFANDAGEFITAVYGNDEALRRCVQAINQQSFHVRLQLLQTRMPLDNLVPGLQR
jgi:predicted peptidase